MRLGVSLLAGGLAATVCAAAAVQLRGAVDALRVPDRIPAAWTHAERSAWIFVLPGCRHCAAHLAALDRVSRRLDARARRELLGRVHVVGAADLVPPEAWREPDGARHALGVRTVPTTLLVDADGRVREAWKGARGEPAWERALAFLDGGGARR